MYMSDARVVSKGRGDSVGKGGDYLFLAHAASSRVVTASE